MENEEQEVGASGDNIVRFPGDWFGPREELVPIGPARSPSDGDQDQPPDPRVDDPGASSPPATRTASPRLAAAVATACAMVAARSCPTTIL